MELANRRLKVVSLFTGGGGLDIGFHQAGFDIVACVEIRADFCKTLELNKGRYSSPDCQIVSKDIRDVQPDELAPSACDFIIGGPPCQSFSAAARRAGGVMGVLDQRGSLFEHYCRLIRQLQPKGFLFENVRGILSANKRKDWEAILGSFSELGYRVSFRILDAADYGVPQHRERLILVGTKDDRAFLFPRPTHGPDSTSATPHISCMGAIVDLQDHNEPEHDYGGRYGHLLKQVPPGCNYHFFTRELGYPSPIFAWRSRFSDFLYKAHPDHPVRTIVARLGAYSGPFHWKNRRFTVEEFKRLFTFPDDYHLAGSLNLVLEQLGNSVAPAFCETLAKAVLKQVFDANVDIDLLKASSNLCFDHIKSEKARRTRAIRLKNDVRELPLFAHHDRPNTTDIIAHNVYYAFYPTRKKVVRGNKIAQAWKEPVVEVHERRQGSDVQLTVTRISGSELSEASLLNYGMRFNRTIGDGFTTISCELRSNSDEDIVSAWDAIEYYINAHSEYLSLMDVYGHFTEPHPLFELDLDINSHRSSFLLHFAEYFSHFSRLGIDCEASLLASFQHESERADFLDTIKYLRSLRFDVRVFETNPTIPPGYFRCCYPFTLHIDKQISVSWNDGVNGNSRASLLSTPT